LAVRFPEPSPRLVPIRARYTDMVREAVELSGGGRFLERGSREKGPHGRWVDMHEVWRAAEVIGIGQLQPARMRNTWICAHLSNGTPLPHLAKLCGFVNPRVERHAR
jgi:hypothetical protein